MSRKNKSSVNYQILTKEQIIRIFQYFAFERKYPYYPPFLKFRTMLSYYIQLSMGLRPKEAYNILLCNIDLEKHILFIPETDNKERFADFVYIPDETYDYIKCYLVMRKKYFPDNPYLFPSHHKAGRLNYWRYCEIFRQATLKTGINRVKCIDSIGRPKYIFNNYTLRHTYLTNAWIQLKDLRKVKILARHRDYDMRCTARYIHTSEELERSDIVRELPPQIITFK